MILLLFFVGAAGCGDTPLAWWLEHNPESLRLDAVSYETSITEGSCSGGRELFRVDFDASEGISGAAPPILEPGVYCFAAEAVNASCETYARGEARVELPTEEVVVVLAALEDPVPSCPLAACDRGRCEAVPECMAPRIECDGRPETVCETNTETSIEHCGGCNNPCMALAEECFQGVCCAVGSGGVGFCLRP